MRTSLKFRSMEVQSEVTKDRDEKYKYSYSG